MSSIFLGGRGMNLYKEFPRIVEAIRRKAEEIGVADGLIELELEADYLWEAMNNGIPEGIKCRALYSLSSGSVVNVELPVETARVVEGGIEISFWRLFGGSPPGYRGTKVLSMHISVNGGTIDQNEKLSWVALLVINDIMDKDHDVRRRYMLDPDTHKRLIEMALQK